MGYYGELVSDIVEELFEDGLGALPGGHEPEGTNQTGTYAVRVRLTIEVPELVPINGSRIRISCKGIQTLCTKCFGKHHKSKCGSVLTSRQNKFSINKTNR